MELAEKIYAAVRLIPRGKVATYSQIAALVGNRNLRRYVGNALHKNPSNAITPCHRVVNAKGFFVIFQSAANGECVRPETV